MKSYTQRVANTTAWVTARDHLQLVLSQLTLL